MLGEACALAAALSWSISLVLFKRSEAVSPQAMNLFKNAVATVLLVLTLPLIGQGIDLERTGEDWARLVVSGVLGIAVADTLTFMALRRLGAGLLAVVDCGYAPTIVLLSVLVLGEPLFPALGVGAALVLGGVLLATRKGSAAEPESLEPRGAELGKGAALGAIGIVCMAIGVILAKPALERGNLVEVTLVRLVAGLLIQLAWVAAIPGQRSALAVFKARSVWRTLLPASVLGTYVAMLFWLGGFKWASVSVAAVLNQLSSIMTIVLAWIFLGERLTGRRVVGALLAIAGALVVLTGNVS